MTKAQFISVLEQGAILRESKIECLQFYIDHYPVFIRGQWTALKIRIVGGSQKLIDYAFAKLQQRVVELKNFK